VLFLVAISQRFNIRQVRIGLLCVSLIVLLVAVSTFVQYPVA
jgi:hypothetical protein